MSNRLPPSAPPACPDCDAMPTTPSGLSVPVSALSRRDFIRVASVGLAASSLSGASLSGMGRLLAAEGEEKSKSENLVKTLYESLTRRRRKRSASPGITPTTADCSGRMSPTTGM